MQISRPSSPCRTRHQRRTRKSILSGNSATVSIWVSVRCWKLRTSITFIAGRVRRRGSLLRFEARVRNLSSPVQDALTTQLEARANWYRSAAKVVDQLPDDGDGVDPTQDYVMSGDMAKDAAADLDRAVAALRREPSK